LTSCVLYKIYENKQDFFFKMQTMTSFLSVIFFFLGLVADFNGIIQKIYIKIKNYFIYHINLQLIFRFLNVIVIVTKLWHRFLVRIDKGTPF
jgi:hypothetical protein